MSMQSEIVKEGKVKSKLFKKLSTKIVKRGVVILLLILTVVIGLRTSFFIESKTMKIGFEDIGELATQSAYCTELNVINDSRDLGAFAVPFTQSKYISTYDIVIKAGFDFEDIEWKENGTSIEVQLPEAKILSSEIKLDSFKVYHEEESIFNKITMTENNDALKDLQQKAEENTIENGLLDNARTNVETILTGFFSSVYDMEEYEIIFKDK